MPVFNIISVILRQQVLLPILSWSSFYQYFTFSFQAYLLSHVIIVEIMDSIFSFSYNFPIIPKPNLNFSIKFILFFANTFNLNPSIILLWGNSCVYSELIRFLFSFTLLSTVFQAYHITTTTHIIHVFPRFHQY